MIFSAKYDNKPMQEKPERHHYEAIFWITASVLSQYLALETHLAGKFHKSIGKDACVCWWSRFALGLLASRNIEFAHSMHPVRSTECRWVPVAFLSLYVQQNWLLAIAVAQVLRTKGENRHGIEHLGFGTYNRHRHYTFLNDTRSKNYECRCNYKLKRLRQMQGTETVPAGWG
jgi:hypothetical protein